MGFDQGLSGLNSASQNLNVIGNNIANATTVGFKSSAAQFADVYAASVYGVSSLAVGIGSKVAAVAQSFTQGSISVTNNPLNLAISGTGFFKMDQNGVDTYTRNGQFQMNAQGYITDSSGRNLLGYMPDSTGAIATGGNPVPILVSQSMASPKATTTASIVANLNSASTAIPAATAINPSDSSTYSYTTTLTVYDGAGTAQPLSMYFQNNGSNGWTVAGYIGGGAAANQVDLNGAAAGKTASLVFNPANGTLASATGINGAAPASITGIALGAGTFSLNLTGTTQYGSASGVSSSSQDGYSTGTFSSLSVDSTGEIQGSYTNGQTAVLGQVALTNFQNPNGLQALGDNQWAATITAGTPVTGTPGTGVLGTLQTGAVEESNVDLTSELVNLIVAQRMYQANSQTIKAEDAILQTLVNLG